MKKGFTLAEVLITLGIIGVVAAMTIPTLISNYQKQSYVTAFKKGYAQVQNAFKLMLAQEGVNYMTQTNLYKSIISDTSGDYSQYLASNLGNYIKITEACSGGENCFFNTEYNALNGTFLGDLGNVPFARLGDGMVIGFFFMPPYTLSEEQCMQARKGGGSMCSFFSMLYLDINGEQNPNVMGRDLFAFIIDNNGVLFPYGSKSTSVFPNSSDVTLAIPYWKDVPSNCDVDAATDMSGAGCAARIIDEGWKMNY